MLCSIIIPFFNRASLLPETVESIIGQSYTNWECILIDDASTDNSYDVAIKYSLIDSRIKVFRRPFYLKKGANTCRNYGFKKSNGKYIHWFDSDDLMSFDMIEKIMNVFVSNQVEMVVSGASFFSGHIKNKKLGKYKSIFPVTDNPAFEFFAGNFWFGTPQAIFRRELIASLPYIFNTNLIRNQETELYVRILLSDLKISYINESLLYIRLHDFSISGKYSMMSSGNKMIVDVDAYISMYLAFKKSNKLTDEVKKYFNNYFFKCLKKMNHKNFKFFKLFVFGNLYSLFPSRSLATKIFFYRLFTL